MVLLNEYTASAAEEFVDVMKRYTDAVFVGSNTAGTSGQPLFENLRETTDLREPRFEHNVRNGVLFCRIESDFEGFDK